jgi:DNA-binding ferritin-like protein
MKIKGVTGKTYVDLSAEIRHYLEGKELEEFQDTINHSKLKEENKRLQDALSHITSLITEYGLCRPETQLARMELSEATVRYVENRNWDDKNMGVIAKRLISEMREKGELP